MGKSFGRNDGLMIDSSAVAVTESGISLYTAWPRLGSITLLAEDWVAVENSDNTWTQELTLSGVTNHSKIDLQSDINVESALLASRTRSIHIVNNDGNIYAIAEGIAAPNIDLTIQCIITEVHV